MREDLIAKYQDLADKITSIEAFKAEPQGLSFIVDFAYAGNYENMIQIMHGIVAADSIIGTNVSKLTIDDIFGTEDVSAIVRQELAKTATGSKLVSHTKAEKAKRVHFLRLFTDACLTIIKRIDKSGKFGDIKFVAESSAKVYNICFNSSMQYRENLNEDEIWSILYDMYGRAKSIAGFAVTDGDIADKVAAQVAKFNKRIVREIMRKWVADEYNATYTDDKIQATEVIDLDEQRLSVSFIAEYVVENEGAANFWGAIPVKYRDSDVDITDSGLKQRLESVVPEIAEAIHSKRVSILDNFWTDETISSAKRVLALIKCFKGFSKDFDVSVDFNKISSTVILSYSGVSEVALTLPECKEDSDLNAKLSQLGLISKHTVLAQTYLAYNYTFADLLNDWLKTVVSKVIVATYKFVEKKYEDYGAGVAYTAYQMSRLPNCYPIAYGVFDNISLDPDYLNNGQLSGRKAMVINNLFKQGIVTDAMYARTVALCLLLLNVLSGKNAVNPDICLQYLRSREDKINAEMVV